MPYQPQPLPPPPVYAGPADWNSPEYIQWMLQFGGLGDPFFDQNGTFNLRPPPPSLPTDGPTGNQRPPPPPMPENDGNQRPPAPPMPDQPWYLNEEYPGLEYLPPDWGPANVPDPANTDGVDVSGTDPYEWDEQDWADWEAREGISAAVYDENDPNYSGRSVDYQQPGPYRGSGPPGMVPPNMRPYTYPGGFIPGGGGGGFTGGSNGQAPPTLSNTGIPPVPPYSPPTYSPPTPPGQLPPPPAPGVPPFPTQWPEDSVGIPDWQAANPTGFEGYAPEPEDPETARLRAEKEANANPPEEGEGQPGEDEPEAFEPPVFTPPGGGSQGYGGSAGWNGTPAQQYEWMIANGIDPYSANNPFLGQQDGGFSPPPPPDLTGGQGGPPDQNVPWEQPQWTPPDYAPPDAGGAGGTPPPAFNPPAPPPGYSSDYPPDQGWGGYPPQYGMDYATIQSPQFNPPQYTDPFAGDPNAGQGYAPPQPIGDGTGPQFQPPVYEQGAPWNDPTGGQGPQFGQPPQGVPGADQAMYGQMDGGQLLGDLSGGFQGAQDAATAANEGRYRSILEGYGDVYRRAMGTVAGISDQDRQDLNRQYERAKAQGEQDLISRGLGNTTIRPTVMRGYEEDLAAGNRRLSDARMREMIGLDTSLSQGALDFAERRTDAGPDYGQLAQLGQGLGQAGYNQQSLPPPPPVQGALVPDLRRRQPLYPVF